MWYYQFWISLFTNKNVCLRKIMRLNKEDITIRKLWYSKSVVIDTKSLKHILHYKIFIIMFDRIFFFSVVGHCNTVLSLINVFAINDNHSVPFQWQQINKKDVIFVCRCHHTLKTHWKQKKIIFKKWIFFFKWPFARTSVCNNISQPIVHQRRF